MTAAARHCLLVLGATGATGRHIVRQALERGHTVTAVARRPERLGFEDPQLNAVACDLTDNGTTLERTIPGHDVVVSALGRGAGLRAHGLLARAVPPLIAAMQRQGPRRLVLLTAYGVANTAPDAPLFFRLMFRYMLADIYADKAAGEAAVRGSTLDWTLLAPVVLANTAGTGRYALGENVSVRGFAKIARADVAACVLDVIDDPSAVGRRLLVGPSSSVVRSPQGKP